MMVDLKNSYSKFLDRKSKKKNVKQVSGQKKKGIFMHVFRKQYYNAISIRQVGKISSGSEQQAYLD